MELKVGQTIYAIKEYSVDGNIALIKQKGYPIMAISKIHFGFTSEFGELYFRISDFAEYFTTEPPKTERYFIVFYDGNTDIGYCEVITTDGQYISQTQAREAIKEHVGHENHSITNIIELNQQDYESWDK